MNTGYYQEYQDTPVPRRHSVFGVTLAPKMRNRSHSLGLVNVSGFSPGLSTMNPSYQQSRPATPCFMSPRMAFTTQFGFESPIEIMTSGSGAMNVFDPRSVSRLRRCSLRRLSRKWKIVLILLFSAIGTGLFITRKMHEASKAKAESASCSGDKCEEEPHDHPGLAERFMGVVSLEKIQKHFHTLTQDLGRSIPGDEADPTSLTAQEGKVIEHPTEDVKSLEHISDEDLKYLDRKPRNSDPQMAYQTVEEMDTERQQKPRQARKIVVATNKESSNSRQKSGNGRGRTPDRSSGKPSRPVRIPPGVNPRRYGM